MAIERWQILVQGSVQGMGFRPFVFRLANNLALTGYVQNCAGIVKIEAQGKIDGLKEFSNKLVTDCPRMSKVENVSRFCVEPMASESSFRILAGISDSTRDHNIPADLAVCASCSDELFDPDSRRYLYPFISCTNCGPRFTIVKVLPYERCNTSMGSFSMCLSCQREYEDPGDKRFHFQGNCCADCGPSLELLSSQGQPLGKGTDALRLAINALTEGRIVALKGLGGFHLACDALNNEAVQRLRDIKNRPEQSLALMVQNTDYVRSLVEASDNEIELLKSAQAPVVILPVNWRSKNISRLVSSINPDGNTLGVFLPYTPLHQLLCRIFNHPLVMTSGNTQGLPIAITIDQALEMLAGKADFFVTHNREIIQPCDDSVLLASKRVHYLRRSRGFAPEAVKLPFKTQANILACGAHLKNTICVTKADNAFISQYLGTLDNIETSRQFHNNIRHYVSLLNCSPGAIACDAHPDYTSSIAAERLAKEYQLPLIKVQHHHAHIAAVMAENQLNEPVIGVAFDGLGYGWDGSLWGGEFFICDYSFLDRQAYLRAVPMCGGTRAIIEPWRMAVSYLLEFESELDFVIAQKFLGNYKDVALLRKQREAKLNAPLTSSCGRLFDAVASLLNLKQTITYEGQAAILLQRLAEERLSRFPNNTKLQPYSFTWQLSKEANSAFEAKSATICNTVLLLKELLTDLQNGVDKGLIALRFHRTLANIVLEGCINISMFSGITKVVLGGGVFQNELLLSMCESALLASGFSVYSAEKVPTNDGGISLGQVAIASALLNKNQMNKDIQASCV